MMCYNILAAVNQDMRGGIYGTDYRFNERDI